MIDAEADKMARWRANRRRMTLSPDVDALAFSRALKLLTDAAGGDTSALHRLTAVGSSADSSSRRPEELASLQERIAQLEAHVGELADVAQTRSAQITGLQQELDAYRPLGTAEEVRTASDRWRAIAEVVFRLLTDFERVYAQYEADLGPVLLQLDRRCSSLSAILQSLAGVPSPPLQAARGLLPGLVDLGADPDVATVDLKTAIETLQQWLSTEDASADTVVDLARHPLAIVASAEFQSLLRPTDPSGGGRSLLRVLDEPALAALHESLRTTGRLSPLRLFGVSSIDPLSSNASSATATANDCADPGDVPAMDGSRSESDDFDAPLTPSRSNKRRRLRQGGRPNKQQRGSASGGGVVAPSPSPAPSPKVIVLSGSDRSESSGSDGDGETLPLVVLAQSSRKKHHINMPTTQSKLVKARDAELRRFKLNDEAHGSNGPWPFSDPRRRDTPDSVAQLAAFPWQLGLFRDEVLAPKTSQFRNSKRNSDLTPGWLGHLELLLGAIVASDSDVDTLLDPFFVWTPVFGVELAIPRLGESLSACVRRLDAAEPQRLYFRPLSTRPRLPLAAYYDRIVEKMGEFTYTSFEDLLASWTRTSDSPGIPTEVRLLTPASPPRHSRPPVQRVQAVQRVPAAGAARPTTSPTVSPTAKSSAPAPSTARVSAATPSIA
ncbi:hypothetical protein P43SY_007543 [Pythium insidiosum]|uniref:Uncharacterized protein n=1 Tax=Pythium insidiosum TaxID=114742 RepID=A0AAD5LI11_PYTIN|nr:hypothetical protein P43SY_007543 [Pythium insidiosum]